MLLFKNDMTPSYKICFWINNKRMNLVFVVYLKISWYISGLCDIFLIFVVYFRKYDEGNGQTRVEKEYSYSKYSHVHRNCKDWFD